MLAFAVLHCACGSRAKSAAPRRELEITTALPGAPPSVIESDVTTPLERQLGQMPRLADMHSHSQLGLSTIDVAFEPGADTDASLVAVEQAIKAASPLLPRTLPAPPVYRRVGTVVARYELSSHVLPLRDIREAIDPLVQRISEVAGVASVEICGASRREIHIDVDPVVLTMAGLTPLDVVEAIQKAQPFDDPRPVVVAERNGLPLRVVDVALNGDSEGQPTCIASTERGRIVEMIISGQPGVDAATVHDRIVTAMADPSATLPSIDVHAVGVMHVFAIRGLAISEIVADAVEAPHVLIEQRGNTMRLAVDADDAVVAKVRAQLERSRQGTVVEPDATLELTGASRDRLLTFAYTLAPKLGPLIPIGMDQETTLHVEVDRDAASRLGVTASAIDGTLATLGGFQAATVVTQVTQIPVIVGIRSDPKRLDAVYVHSTRGDMVPLTSIAKLVEVPDGERWHAGQFPMVGFRVRTAAVPDLSTLQIPPSVHAQLVPD